MKRLVSNQNGEEDRNIKVRGNSQISNNHQSAKKDFFESLASLAITAKRKNKVTDTQQSCFLLQQHEPSSLHKVQGVSLIIESFKRFTYMFSFSLINFMRLIDHISL